MTLDEWHIFDDGMRLFLLILIGVCIAMLCGFMKGMAEVM